MIKLSCKSCGAKLELTDDIDRFSCAHCGSEWAVERGGGIVCLKPVVEKLEKIEIHTKEIVNEFQNVAIAILRQIISARQVAKWWEDIENFLVHEFLDPNINRTLRLRFKLWTFLTEHK
jgi:hypothetical protein